MVRKTAYVPGKGDLVWLNMNPQAGHEQAGFRPALTLSPKSYNSRTGLMLACPITSSVKGYPFEVPLPEGIGVGGVVLSDQVKSLDWRARRARFIHSAGHAVTAEVIGKLSAILEI
jgi:mRNA interferase MazF